MAKDSGVNWFGDEVLKKTNIIMDGVTEDVAKLVESDAKKILKRKAKTTTEKGLLDQFSIVESKFKHGGHIVYVQGPGDWKKPYHASFLEMGTFKDEAKPFLRPGYKKNRSKANKMFQDAMD